MVPLNRREFLGGALAAGSTLAATSLTPVEAESSQAAQSAPEHNSSADPGSGASIIDFRYAPVIRQTALCFPDDPHKSLVSQDGELLYGYQFGSSCLTFPLRIGFALGGMLSPGKTSQQLESPGVPIVRTTLEYPSASILLTTFATNDAAEGRVDNVIVDISAKSNDPVNVELLIKFQAIEKFDFAENKGAFTVVHRGTKDVLLVGKAFGNDLPAEVPAAVFDWNGEGPDTQWIRLRHGQASHAKPYRAFFRFPQAKQTAASLEAGLADPERCLESCRAFWSSWSAFRHPVDWKIPDRPGQFVEACARNILQAREVRDGKLTFQVGATCYRGLWVVDGNFILEAARYLGYDKDAEEGLRTTWSKQLSNGQFVAGGGQHHWKDTAIAMFTLARQCELSQDWTALHDLEPQVLKAISFLRSLQADAVKEGSALGRYGLLAKGVADGGINGPCEELTNTAWALAGLKAIAETGERQKVASLKDARPFYNQLRAAFLQAASHEFRRYPTGFQYLPILLKDDPEWNAPDPWDRPHPQTSQWAFSQAIFPGCVFDPQDPIVQGHAKLMQAVTQEDIPAETGWARHESVWTYNAAFVAEVYLWLGMKKAAHDTFIGFLNHASAQYCWREEQQLQNALVGTYIGDMPHNWASAECIRYVRHMLALEDGTHLRLLAGITDAELATSKEYDLTGTPTRFGRLHLRLEPLDRGQGWRLVFERKPGQMPEKISLPRTLGSRFQFSQVEGASSRLDGDLALVDTAAPHWTAYWKR